MLILIGADSNNLTSPVAKRFGHANYYIVYNTETKSFEAIENIKGRHHHENLNELTKKGIETFIVGNIGPHAFEVINTEKSKVFLARKMSVQEAIDKFLQGGLLQLNEPTVKKSIGHSNIHHDK
ncbi:MAG: NifB/NifX family molybdenum-iron cluster-binding protein [Melioribacter sp.]|uniref:NifB/NifX family molybdenum-iron cluster-binding protein n=1 Tax=Rosettibacter primus TaxID=3111523 RepID=UPI00247CDD8B|nr:NifB/NifX family molybdenum-iron cluster-binding protein [Melioribacter sp.]